MIPLIKDGFSHAFAKAIHIATVHALYGANHVDKEIENAIGNNAKNHHSAKHAESFEVHIPSEQNSYCIDEKNNNKLFASHKPHFLKKVLIYIQSPPPRLS